MLDAALQDTRDLVASAAALAPLLASRAQAAERDRQVPAENVALLRRAELLRILVPRRFGGLEQDLVTAGRVVEALGAGCGATAWMFGVATMHTMVVATFPFEAQEEIWADAPQALVSGSYAPNPKAQTAQRVEGGFRLSGRWGFASGCDHADWHMVQFLLFSGPEAPPQPYFAIVPRAEFRIEDDWNVMGLSGTGSKTVVFDDVFVPSHRTLEYAKMNAGTTPGAAMHANPVYGLPFMSFAPLSISCPVVGMARGALASVLAGAAVGSHDSAVRGKFADHVMAHNWIGQAMAEIDAASLVIQGALERLELIAGERREPTRDERVRVRRDYAFGIRLCVHAVQALLNCSGASGITLDNPVQRAWRDVNAAARHLGLNWEPYAIQSGRNALGLDPKGLF